MKKEALDTPAKVRRCVSDKVVRLEKALDALVAEGSVSSVGTVNELSVYDRPVSRPKLMEPTNFSVETVLPAIVSSCRTLC